MSIATTPAELPHVDAAVQDCITDQQAQFFRDNGLLVIRNVLRGAELKQLQEQTLLEVQRAIQLTPTNETYRDRVSQSNGSPLMSLAAPEHPERKDYFYQAHKLTGDVVPFRVEYIIDKCPACRALLAHPFILRSVEKLQGPDFIPTWDSVVFKNPGAGAAIAWHRDDDSPATHQSDIPIFNVDFYLDGSDMSNCLWGILGSNRWSKEQAQRKVAELNSGGAFKTDESCTPIPMNPGDVIFHNIHALHGSPPARSALRRVVYYEFRPIAIERAHGPHNEQYIPLKQRLLLQCLKDRAATEYAAGERTFTYRPSAAQAPPQTSEPLSTYRYPHEQFWRKA